MRRRKAEQKKQSRERKKQKRLLELERQRERNKTIISYRGQQVVNMEEEEGILFSRGVEIHVDKCLRFYCGVPKFRGARRSVYRHAVKGILMTISSILAASN